MRRALSILLVLVFSAGPLLFAFQANDSSLPACCRRHGAHHCAMDSAESAADSAASPILKAPSRCPRFPQHANARTSACAAVLNYSHVATAIACDAERSGPAATGHISIHLRTPVLRGPPASHLA